MANSFGRFFLLYLVLCLGGEKTVIRSIIKHFCRFHDFPRRRQMKSNSMRFPSSAQNVTSSAVGWRFFPEKSFLHFRSTIQALLNNKNVVETRCFILK